MTALVEGLGMSLPGTTIPAVTAARLHAAEAAGRRAVELAREGLKRNRKQRQTSRENHATRSKLGGGVAWRRLASSTCERFRPNRRRARARRALRLRAIALMNPP